MAIPTVTDRNVQYPSRVELTEVSTGVYDVTPVPGNVVAEGTDVNKALLDQYAVETQVTASTAKTTPIDADTMPLVDSAASGVLKKVTWANIKATLKTYFDSLYAPALVWHDVGGAGEPVFTNSWVNYDTSTYHAAGFCKDVLGFVHVRGLIKSGASTSIAFTLPVGYRPSKQMGFAALSPSFAQVVVSASGTVILTGADVGTYSYLDVIHFYAG